MTKKTWQEQYEERIEEIKMECVAFNRDYEKYLNKQAKRQRLIAYLIGVVIGMAIGSLVMRAIYG